MKTDNLLKMGRQYDRLHQTEKRAREQRQAFTEKYLTGGRGFWGSCSWGDSQMVVDIPLADYLQAYPAAAPALLHTNFDDDRKAYMKYPAQFIGELRPGFHMFVEAHSKMVPAPRPTATPAPAETTETPAQAGA